MQLGVYLRDYVAGLSTEEKERDSAPKESGWGGGEESIDFKAGQMFLSHDKETNSFYLQAHERETDEERQEEDTESVSFWITLARLARWPKNRCASAPQGGPLASCAGNPSTLMATYAPGQTGTPSSRPDSGQPPETDIAV